MQKLIKKVLLRTSVLMFIINLSACNNEAKTEQNIVQAANTEMQFKIEGMTCEMGCVSAIKKQLGETKGIYSYDIDFNNKTAVVEFNKEQITADEISNTVEKVNQGAYKVDNKKTKCIAQCKEKNKSNADVHSSSSSDKTKMSHDSFQIPNIFGLLQYLIQ